MDSNYIERGDCTKLMKTLSDKSIDVCLPSPPYNRIRNDVYAVHDDNLINYFDLLVETATEMLRVSKKCVLINIQQNYFNKKDVFKFIGHFNDKIAGVIVWEKSNPQPGNNPRKDGTNSVVNAYEYIFMLTHDGEEFRAYNKNVKNHITTTVNALHFEGHSAVMKKEVCDWLMTNFTQENDIILDPFLGTGTTAVCAVEQKRNYIGYELHQEYFNVACERLDEVEGKEAV